MSGNENISGKYFFGSDGVLMCVESVRVDPITHRTIALIKHAHKPQNSTHHNTPDNFIIDIEYAKSCIDLCYKDPSFIVRLSEAIEGYDRWDKASHCLPKAHVEAPPSVESIAALKAWIAKFCESMIPLEIYFKNSKNQFGLLTRAIFDQMYVKKTEIVKSSLSSSSTTSDSALKSAPLSASLIESTQVPTKVLETFSASIPTTSSVPLSTNSSSTLNADNFDLNIDLAKLLESKLTQLISYSGLLSQSARFIDQLNASNMNWLNYFTRLRNLINLIINGAEKGHYCILWNELREKSNSTMAIRNILTLKCMSFLDDSTLVENESQAVSTVNYLQESEPMSIPIEYRNETLFNSPECIIGKKICFRSYLQGKWSWSNVFSYDSKTRSYLTNNGSVDLRGCDVWISENNKTTQVQWTNDDRNYKRSSPYMWPKYNGLYTETSKSLRPTMLRPSGVEIDGHFIMMYK